MQNKQLKTVCNFPHLHPVRDVSLGRRDINPTILHPVRDASLTGCKGISSFSFSTKRCIPNGMPVIVITYIFHLNK
ncbi:MAG: hypothetical protein FWH18_09675 [Marinilabiliaceae bacterium]|nr:hypothetical protein [Marinilabiliaceae bacterium]